MKTKYYIHTIDGKPATFDGWQICFASHYGHPNIVRTSLKQIREDQIATAENRKASGLEDDPTRYGYVRYA